MSVRPGVLYVVATPIGNLEDISPRALRILGEVDLIAAEDTRHSRRLLQHYAIGTPLRSYHDFNEEQAGDRLLEILQSGQDVALISDAGTPLISDPGYRLVRAAHERAVRVVPVPGPSALIAALSAAGLPTDRFLFAGYPPAKKAARREYFAALVDETATLVFYEAPHRIRACLADAVEALGPEREAVLARELTKHFETIRKGTLSELSRDANEAKDRSRGEFVVLIRGIEAVPAAGEEETARLLGILLEEMPLKKAAALAAKISGRKKNELYSLGLALVRSKE